MLKNKLSEYVRRAASGETILITDRDRVVAELTPPDPSRAVRVADAVLSNAVRDGLLTPPLTPPGPPPETTSVATLEEILAGLDADRADR